MNRNRSISTLALGAALGLLPLAAIADHMDYVPNAANRQSSVDADSQFVGTSKVAPPAVSATRIAGTTPPARTTQADREARARATSMQDLDMLAVPNHPEFGRVGTK